METKELLQAVADLVESRETIEHGAIRRLCPEAPPSIRALAAYHGARTGTIGDTDLAIELDNIAYNDSWIADLGTDALSRLRAAFRGRDIADYVDTNGKDQLKSLDALIGAAEEIAWPNEHDTSRTR